MPLYPWTRWTFLVKITSLFNLIIIIIINFWVQKFNSKESWNSFLYTQNDQILPFAFSEN